MTVTYICGGWYLHLSGGRRDLSGKDVSGRYDFAACGDIIRMFEEKLKMGIYPSRGIDEYCWEWRFLGTLQNWRPSRNHEMHRIVCISCHNVYLSIRESSILTCHPDFTLLLLLLCHKIVKLAPEQGL